MHRTHLPLTVWFWVIYLCATDKRGISAVQLSRTLNICYESAWYLLHRIRAAMGKRDEKYELSGIVEMDDSYVGKVTRNGRGLSAASGGQDEDVEFVPTQLPFAILSFDRQRRFLSQKESAVEIVESCSLLRKEKGAEPLWPGEIFCQKQARG